MVRFACSKKTPSAAKNHPRQQMTEAKNGSFRKRKIKIKRLGSLETSPETT
jgi:hypothetical protein